MPHDSRLKTNLNHASERITSSTAIFVCWTIFLVILMAIVELHG
jgi:hypothetical protein